MIFTLIGIFIFSLILALRSMKDHGLPEEIKKLMSQKKVKGTILIMKDKVNHYSSTSSSSG